MYNLQTNLKDSVFELVTFLYKTSPPPDHHTVTYEILVELWKPRLPVVVKNKNSLNHDRCIFLISFFVDKYTHTQILQSKLGPLRGELTLRPEVYLNNIDRGLHRTNSSFWYMDKFVPQTKELNVFSPQTANIKVKCFCIHRLPQVNVFIH